MCRSGSGWQFFAGVVLLLSVVWAHGQTTASSESSSEVRIYVDGEGMGVRYLGRCEQEAALLIEPVYMNDTDRAMRALERTPMLPPFERLARGAAAQYQSACPGVRAIRFALEPLPNAFRCLRGSECFMVLTRKGDDWGVDSAQMGYPPPALTVRSLTDVAEVMAAGRLDLVAGSPTLYAFFASSFLESYGEHCASQLKDPVVLEIQTVRTTQYGDGTTVSKTEGAPSRIPLERGLVDHYKTQRAVAMQGGVMGALGAGNPVAYLQALVSDSRTLDAAVKGHCQDPQIRATYSNLRLALLGLPLEKGQFETAFVAKETTGTPSGSAPAFASQYRSNQRALEQARASAAAAAALPPDVQMPPARTSRSGAYPGVAPDTTGALARPSSSGPAQGARPVGSASDRAAQVSELASTYRQKMAELKASYVENAQNARTPQERTNMMRDYNDKMQALLQAHRQRMQDLIGR